MTFREQLEQARDGFAQAAKQNVEACHWVTAGENAARAKVIDQVLQMQSLTDLEVCSEMLSAGPPRLAIPFAG